MFRLIYIALICIVSLEGNCQTIFQDSISALPIGGVNIYNKEGNFIAFTDVHGTLQFVEGFDQNQESNFPVTIQHISYESKVIPIELFRNNKIIKLIPRSILLDDIVVSAKQPDVMCIRGYFRTLETFNLKHKYYIDGIIEYYIPTNGKKVKFKLIDYRIFCDSLVLEEFKDKMGNNFSMDFLPEVSLHSVLFSSNDYTVEKRSNKKSTIRKDNDTVGHIVYVDNPEQLQIYVDLISPNTIKKEKILRLEANTYHDIRIENYSSDSLSDIGIKNLISLNQNLTASIKRKSEFGHLPFEGLTELYILDRSGLSFGEFGKIKRKLSANLYKKPKKSSYHNEYWESLEQNNIPLPNKGLKAQLGDNLKLVE